MSSESNPSPPTSSLSPDSPVRRALPLWAAGLIGVVGLVALGLVGTVVVPGYVESYINRTVEQKVAIETAKIRKLYEADSKAAQTAVSGGFKTSNERLRGLEDDVKRLVDSHAEIKATVDTYLRSSVSPAALKKVADQVAALQTSLEKTQASVTGTASIQGDVTRLSEYLTSQMYPALLAVQNQVKELAEKQLQAAEQRHAAEVPIGVLLPSLDQADGAGVTLQNGTERAPVRRP